MAVIVTTYNRPDALLATLTALAQQTRLPAEIIVADDGSTTHTADAIARWQKPDHVRVTHVWHEDRGFRAAAIRNRAIAHSSSDYLIFVDGDCVARENFVALHSELADNNRFVAGNRILLSRALTQRILAERIDYSRSTWPDWIKLRMRGELNRLLPLVRLPNGAWRCHGAKRWEGAKTCNLAVWREDLARVNGFDESFEGWGFEDSDLVIRLIRAGVRRTDGRFATGVFHLWHRENDRGRLAENLQLLDNVQKATYVKAKVGVSEAVPESVRVISLQ